MMVMSAVGGRFLLLVLCCVGMTQGHWRLAAGPVKTFPSHRPTRMMGKEKLLMVSANQDIEPAPQPALQLNAIDLCLCGAFATALGDFIMHPIDTIKIAQQTATVAKGLLGTALELVKVKGVSALYQGVTPYLIGDGLSGAVKFATFELSRRFAERKLPAKYHATARFICAAIAMFACSVILVPAEVLKTRLQAGSFLPGALIYGLAGFFVGYYALLVRDVPYTMLELGIYENLKSFINFLKRKECTANDELLAAAVTGAVTAYVTTPLDLVKTKLMMQSASGGKYAGVADALFSIYAEGGLRSLFVGSAARIAWLLPFTTIYLGIYEAAKRFILQSKQRKLLV